MSTLAASLRSSVGKKYLMGFTGLVWFGFTIGHLIGNYLLILGRKPFNEYAYFLEHVGHGKLIFVAEFFLALTLLIHVSNGIQVMLDKGNARPTGYQVSGDAKGSSKKGIASQSMIVTGILLLGFIIFHIYSFKFGNKAEIHMDGYVEPVKDLYQLVVDSFKNPAYTGFYVVVMLALGTHLSHGIWSACQSLGLLNRRTYPVVAGSAGIIATLLAAGFVFLPIAICVLNNKFAMEQGGLF